MLDNGQATGVAASLRLSSSSRCARSHGATSFVELGLG